MPYRVVWDNGHSSGTLPGDYDTEAEAEAAGKDWKADMVAADPDPAEAERAYDYMVSWVDMHLMPTRGNGTECGGDGPATPDINKVTCDDCIERHERRTSRHTVIITARCPRCGAVSAGGAYCPNGCGRLDGSMPAGGDWKADLNEWQEATMSRDAFDDLRRLLVTGRKRRKRPYVLVVVPMAVAADYAIDVPAELHHVPAGPLDSAAAFAMRILEARPPGLKGYLHSAADRAGVAGRMTATARYRRGRHKQGNAAVLRRHSIDTPSPVGVVAGVVYPVRGRLAFVRFPAFYDRSIDPSMPGGSYE